MKNSIYRIQSWVSRLASISARQGVLSKLFLPDQQPSRAQRYLKYLCESFGWYHLLLVQKQRDSGDYCGAFKTLMLGQRRRSHDFRFHLKLSELYRDNGDVYSAYAHLKIADKLSPGYSTIRRLTFETDCAMYTEGYATLARILTFSKQLIYRHFVMINRVLIFYPDCQKTVALDRVNYKKKLLSGQYKNKNNLSSAVENAISNRWLDVALSLRNTSNCVLCEKTDILLNRLETDLGPYSKLLDLGWENEDSDNLAGYRSGELVSLCKGIKTTDQLVEIFLPTPFFTKPDQEKPTYATVRQMFVQVIRFFCKRPNLTLVPRLQLNWKRCFPKVTGARVVSYHTFSSSNNSWLHIQESPLAGRCSFDNTGFAGFSSIAFNHSVIDKFTNSISESQIIENQDKMLENYVSKNISKYIQYETNEPIAGSYVFVVMQVQTDIVSKLAYISGVELLKNVVKFFQGTNTRVVVKRHPFCTSMGVQKNLEELESNNDIIITKNSIHRVIADAEIVITVNSGVGVEALIQGKTVIVSGACDYSYSAITVRNQEDLYEVLRNKPIIAIKQIQRFLYFYVHRFTIGACDRLAVEQRLEKWLEGET